MAPKKIKVSPAHHFFDESSQPIAVIVSLPLAPMIGFIVSPSFLVGRFAGMARGYAIALAVCFLTPY